MKRGWFELEIVYLWYGLLRMAHIICSSVIRKKSLIIEYAHREAFLVTEDLGTVRFGSVLLVGVETLHVAWHQSEAVGALLNITRLHFLILMKWFDILFNILQFISPCRLWNYHRAM